eukprot:TRINITY_DN17888_c0_g1_i1.p1 TRINITY_DN17888_c0_g1~~TRINITY_DN17888_c0_g1_i1.p1  ORF type:complete len:235 (-),score=56.08 TRINITY_DN17888_c0_g1_i1:165-869(-)
MLLPVGPGPVGFEDVAPPPQSVKDEYAKWWWAYLVLCLGTVVGEILSHDVFGVLMMIGICVIVWYMVKDDCRQMTQYCVFMFGFLCAIQCIFDTVMLVVSVGGRRTQRVEQKQINENKMSYTTVIETHPFFDEGQGFVYNAQSWMMIVSAVLMFLGACLAYSTYNAFPTALFVDEPEERDIFVERRAPGGGPPPGGYGGAEGNRPGAGRFSAAPGGDRRGGFRTFDGEGRRLGA